MSIDEAYTLAHTAQCKLKMAADRPNRDLRFILGHAFTLDKLMCRIVEIENEQESMPKGYHRGQTESCVTFKDDRSAPLRREMNHSTKKGAKGGRARSPPPASDAMDREDSSDSDEYAFDEDEDADDPSLSLSKTTSHIAQQPPNLVPSDGDSSDEDDDDDGPVSPPSKPSDSVLETIIEEDGDETLAELYDGIRRCGCQNDVDKKAPPVAKVWELPQSEVKKSGKGMKPTRKLLVQVQA